MELLHEAEFWVAVGFVLVIVLLVFAAVLGVIAAILPARRASRLDVLESLQYE